MKEAEAPSGMVTAGQEDVGVLSFNRKCNHIVNMVRTQIQLTEEQAALLRETAERENCSVAALIRRAIDQCFRPGAQASVRERRLRAMAVAGRHRSGLGDLSQEHDRYLGEDDGS